MISIVLTFSFYCSLVLRIRCDAKVAQCPLGDKYGCNPDTEAPDLIRLAKKLNLNVCSYFEIKIFVTQPQNKRKITAKI